MTAEDVLPANTGAIGQPDKANAGWDSHFGYGRVNLAGAMARIKDAAHPAAGADRLARLVRADQRRPRAGRAASRSAAARRRAAASAPGRSTSPAGRTRARLRLHGRCWPAPARSTAPFGTIPQGQAQRPRAELQRRGDRRRRPPGGRAPAGAWPARPVPGPRPRAPHLPDPPHRPRGGRRRRTSAATARRCTPTPTTATCAGWPRPIGAGAGRVAATAPASGGEASPRLYDVDGDNAARRDPRRRRAASCTCSRADGTRAGFNGFAGHAPTATRSSRTTRSRWPAPRPARVAARARHRRRRRRPRRRDRRHRRRAPLRVAARRRRASAARRRRPRAVGAVQGRASPKPCFNPADRAITRSNHIKRGFVGSPVLAAARPGDARPRDRRRRRSTSTSTRGAATARSLPGFPKKLATDGADGAEIVTTPAIADLDGQGPPEIVVATNEVAVGDPEFPGSFFEFVSAILSADHGLQPGLRAARRRHARSRLAGEGRRRGRRPAAARAARPRRRGHRRRRRDGRGRRLRRHRRHPGRRRAARRRRRAPRCRASSPRPATGSTPGADAQPRRLPVGRRRARHRRRRRSSRAACRVNGVVQPARGQPEPALQPRRAAVGARRCRPAATWTPARPRPASRSRRTTSSSSRRPRRARRRRRRPPGRQALVGTGMYQLHAYGPAGLEPAGWPKFTGGWTQATPAVGDADGDGDLDVTTAHPRGLDRSCGTPASTPARIERGVVDLPPRRALDRQLRHDARPPGTRARARRPPARADEIGVTLDAPGDDWLCGTPAKIRACGAAGRRASTARARGRRAARYRDRAGNAGTEQSVTVDVAGLQRLDTARPSSPRRRRRLGHLASLAVPGPGRRPPRRRAATDASARDRHGHAGGAAPRPARRRRCEPVRRGTRDGDVLRGTQRLRPHPRPRRRRPPARRARARLPARRPRQRPAQRRRRARPHEAAAAGRDRLRRARQRRRDSVDCGPGRDVAIVDRARHRPPLRAIRPPPVGSGAPMRVLIVSWEYPPIVEGGLGRHVRKLAEGLVPRGRRGARPHARRARARARGGRAPACTSTASPSRRSRRTTSTSFVALGRRHERPHAHGRRRAVRALRLRPHPRPRLAGGQGVPGAVAHDAACRT